jgi:quercetin dioxygenase-like cupin family protein
MSGCGKNEEKEEDNDSIARLLAEGLGEADLSPVKRTSMFGRVLERIADPPPEQTETIRVATMPWRPVCPGVWTKLMKSDPTAQMQVALFRVDPGGVVPAHSHHREEEWLVLQGEVMLGDHCVGQGDFHFAQVGSRHPDLTAPTGALLMVRSEIRSQ